MLILKEIGFIAFNKIFAFVIIEAFLAIKISFRKGFFKVQVYSMLSLFGPIFK